MKTSSLKLGSWRWPKQPWRFDDLPTSVRDWGRMKSPPGSKQAGGTLYDPVVVDAYLGLPREGGEAPRRRKATLGLIVLYRAFVTLSADLEEIVMDLDLGDRNR